jgi:hypothetical protein
VILLLSGLEIIKTRGRLFIKTYIIHGKAYSINKGTLGEQALEENFNISQPLPCQKHPSVQKMEKEKVALTFEKGGWWRLITSKKSNNRYV